MLDLALVRGNQLVAGRGSRSDDGVSPLRLFTLNVSGPSTDRARRLLPALDELDADVLVLTETRNNAGTRLLLDAYRERGCTVLAPTPPTSAERGVALIHRLPPGPPSAASSVDLAQRLVVARIVGDRPFTLIGAYVPSRDASAAKILRKKTFLTQLTTLLNEFPVEEDVVLLGDFNVISRLHVPRYPVFRAWEYDALEAIAAAGLVDAFAFLNPGLQAHSWIGRKGAGYRYDYGFVSQRLVDRLLVCDYLHEFRFAGLSDHAGVVVALDPSGARSTVPPVRRDLVSS
jgi:exodeoxyribonuclease III